MRTVARVLAIGAAALLGLAWLGWQWFQPPSDDAMIANLTRNRAAFERLVAMIREDRVDVDWTRSEDPGSIGVSPQRIAAYRRQMRRIGVRRGFYAFEPRDQISFVAFASGIYIRGQSKSYVWSPSGEFVDSPRMADSLDAVWRSGNRRVWDYRRVEGPWYLHLRVD